MWVIGDHVVNLREDILIHRIKYSLTNMDEDSKDELVSLVFSHLSTTPDLSSISTAWEGRKGT